MQTEHEQIAEEPTTEREGKAAWRAGSVSAVEAAGATHPGRQRAKNEDAFEILADVGLAVVADGLGGHPAGDIASRMAVQEVAEQLRDLDPDPTLPDVNDADALPRATIDMLRAAVKQANRAIHLAGDRFPVCHGMATTIAAVLIARGFAIFAHVGDSRIYRLRDGRLVQLTEDDSMAAEYSRAFGPEADPQILRMQESTLTRCLGIWPDVHVTVRAERRAPGDTYLLCTDGLWTVVPHDTITRIVAETADLAEAAEALIDAANAAGGPDNITAVLLRPILAENGDSVRPVRVG
jgi:serine/threonine protein phosphatase PrpC